MGDISRNFSRSEFECGCGCGFDDVDVRLVKVLQDMRDELGCPVHITSGCRCEEYNREVGGASKSQHLLGTAADVVVTGCTPSYVQQYLEYKHPDSLGIGSYSQFTHIDVRSGRARWSG